MFFKEINTIIGVREDVENVLMDVNDYLLERFDQAFCIGVGLDGPTGLNPFEIRASLKRRPCCRLT